MPDVISNWSGPWELRVEYQSGWVVTIPAKSLRVLRYSDDVKYPVPDDCRDCVEVITESRIRLPESVYQIFGIMPAPDPESLDGVVLMTVEGGNECSSFGTIDLKYEFCGKVSQLWQCVPVTNR